MSKPRDQWLIELAILTVIIAGLVWMTQPVYKQMQLRGRVHYAYAEAGKLQEAVRDHWIKEQSWPSVADDQPGPWHIKYPDGGGAVLSNKVIEIYFEVIPELKPGRIYLTPTNGQAESLNWSCHAEGFALDNILPAECRP